MEARQRQGNKKNERSEKSFGFNGCNRLLGLGTGGLRAGDKYFEGFD